MLSGMLLKKLMRLARILLFKDQGELSARNPMNVEVEPFLMQKEGYPDNLSEYKEKRLMKAFYNPFSNRRTVKISSSIASLNTTLSSVRTVLCSVALPFFLVT